MSLYTVKHSLYAISMYNKDPGLHKSVRSNQLTHHPACTFQCGRREATTHDRAKRRVAEHNQRLGKSYFHPFTTTRISHGCYSITSLRFFVSTSSKPLHGSRIHIHSPWRETVGVTPSVAKECPMVVYSESSSFGSTELPRCSRKRTTSAR